MEEQLIYSNLFCAIDTETTGLDPHKHEIVQIAIQPLNHNFEPLSGVPPFYIDMIPTKPENWKAWDGCNPEEQLEKLKTSGVDANTAKQLLEDWFMRLELIQNRFIIPIGHNWFNFDKILIEKWLGPTLFNDYFHYSARDTMLIAAFINDFFFYKFDAKKPFRRIGLSELCKFFNVPNLHAHNALSDALATAAVYKAFLEMNLG